MDHNIIHHTETVPVREPLTVEQADKLIEQYGDTLAGIPLTDGERAFTRGILTETGVDLMDTTFDAIDLAVVRQALDRIEEARAHGLA